MRSLFLRLLPILIVMAVAVPAHATIVTDPFGDVGPPDFSTPPSTAPDIISMEGTHDTNNLYFSVRFAPGTMSISTLGTLIGLNTDLNPATGFKSSSQPGGFYPIGADYSLNFTGNAIADSGAIPRPPVGCRRDYRYTHWHPYSNVCYRWVRSDCSV